MKFKSELLENLTGLVAVSGQETVLREFIINEIKDHVDEVSVDTLGNVIAHKKGTGKKLAFFAHMDQIGLMVTDIDEKGFVYFSAIGGHSAMNLVGQRVIFANGVQGMIGHEKLNNINELNLSKLYIDIGALTETEARAMVQMGDVCTFDSSYYETENSVISKALDDRIGCYILIEAIKAGKMSENDVYYVFTVMEEVGTIGGMTSAFSIEPDMAIALDVTHTGDTHIGRKMAVALGKGAGIKLKDGGTLTHPLVKKTLTDLAEENNINYQYEILEAGATDTAGIHKQRAGVMSGTISVPTRWMHTASEIVAKSDVLDCLKLAIALQNFDI